MKRFFLAAYPLIGTKHKPAALHLQQRSPYYWWWAFLRRNSEYLACCEKAGTGPLADLYKDFGDVRGEDFRAWWGGHLRRGTELFAEQPLPLKLQKLGSRKEWLTEWDKQGNVMVIALNMDVGRRRLQAQFARLLEREHTGKRGRRAMRTVQSTAKYPLHRNFAVHNLKMTISVYDAWAENQRLPEDHRLTLWQLGESIKLVPSAVTTKDDKNYVEKHNVMAATFSRYLLKAKRMIANTAKGQFPNSEL